MGSRGAVLIVDDVAAWADMLAVLVEEEGFSAVRAGTAAEGIRSFQAARPRVVLLDWVLPDSPGIDLCRRLRTLDPLVTILFVSGRGDEASAVRALDAGADDFLVKPIPRRALMARIESQLRKLAAPGQPGREVNVSEVEADAAPAGLLNFGEVDMDLSAREVSVAGRRVPLGRLEYGLLELLARYAGQAISRDQIMERVYGFESPVPSDRVDILVRRLRVKLGDGPLRAGQVMSVHGFGYRLGRRRAGGVRQSGRA